MWELRFRPWFSLQEAIDANTEMILRRINQRYGLGKGQLPDAELEQLIKQLKDAPDLISVAAAKQQLDARLGIQPKEAPSVNKAAINQARKLFQGPELQPFIDQFIKKELQQDELLIAAYFLGQKTAPALIETVLKEIHDLKGGKQVKLEFKDVPYLNGQPAPDFTTFSTKVHSIQGEYTAKQALSRLVAPTNAQPIATSPDGSISIYLADTHKKCIAHGRGTSFCISSKSSPQWYYQYRFEHEQTQYFIVDKNQQPPADLVNAGVAPKGRYSEWVDRQNSPNVIAGFSSVQAYKGYLDDKFDGNIDNILKPIPLSDQEKKLKLAVDELEKGWSIPEEYFQDPEQMALLLHMGYNIKSQDFFKLPQTFREIYLLNLNNLEERFEAKHLVNRPALLAKWVKNQEELDNVELFRLLLLPAETSEGADMTRPIKTAELLNSINPGLMDNLKIDSEVTDYGIINEKTYMPLVALALWMEEKEGGKGSLWNWLWTDKFEIHYKTARDGAWWLIQNKKDWDDEDLYTFTNYWGDVIHWNRWWSDDAYEPVARLVSGRQLSHQVTHDIIYLTSADNLVMKALGDNLKQIPSEEMQKLKNDINEKGAP